MFRLLQIEIDSKASQMMRYFVEYFGPEPAKHKKIFLIAFFSLVYLEIEQNAGL